MTKGLDHVLAEFIEVTPGIGLHVHGWEKDRPYALIPGWPLAEDMYNYQMSRLTRTGFRAVSIPLRSLSRTAHPWETYDYYLFIDDIVAIANQLDLQAVTLRGRAMGGAIAIHYSSVREGHLVSRLALFGAPGPACSTRASRSSGLEVLGDGEDVKALDVGRPFVIESATEHLGQKEILINAGVATWFLCQGWANNAGPGCELLRACTA